MEKATSKRYRTILATYALTTKNRQSATRVLSR